MAAGPVRRVPSRSCVACRTVRPKRELLRVVRMPDGTVTVDQGGRAAGRGAYVCRDETCLERATDKGALGRALSTRITPDISAALSNAVVTIESNPNLTLHTEQGGARGQE